MQEKHKKLVCGLIIFSLCFAIVVLSIGAASAYGIDGQEKISEALDKQIQWAKDPQGNTWQKVDLPTMIGTIIYFILGFLGIGALVLMIAAGVMWMTAGGNEETAAKAKGLIKGAVIGIIVILAAYTLTYFVVTVVLEDIGAPRAPEVDIEADNSVEMPEDLPCIYSCQEIADGACANPNCVIDTSGGICGGGKTCCHCP